MYYKVVFAEFGLPKKLVLDAGMNFTAEQFRFLQVLKYRSGLYIIVPQPEKWTGGGMHKVCEMHQQEMQTD